jgi:hypothetical protein
MRDSVDVPGSPPRASSRVLLPVPGLTVAGAWQVGPVRFLPAGAAREQVAATAPPGVRLEAPAFQSYLDDRLSVLDRFAVAEVPGASGQEDALAMVSDALAVVRAVQHMRNPMVGMGHQTFGLPGEVPSAVVDYVIVGDGLTVGAARRGALAGWEFTADDHRAWVSESAFRFLDEALAASEPDRTALQARALLAVRLLSQGWLSYQPDLELLNSAIALETLLGESTDQDKKFRIARRVSYFSCGWPGRLYPGTGRTACTLLSLPLSGRRRGAPGPALGRVLNNMRAGRVMRCTQFFDVCAIYDARNEIVHHGQLPADQDRPDTWFIAAQLLGQVLAWFAAHPDSDLSDLDAEIAALPTPSA